MLFRLISYSKWLRYLMKIAIMLISCEFKSYGKITRVAGQGFIM